MAQELVMIFRHGDRLDSHMPTEEEKEQCGGLEVKDDTPLNMQGHKNAKTTGEEVRKIIDAEAKGREVELRLWSSPMLRCVQTLAGIVEGVQLGDDKIDVRICEYLSETMPWHNDDHPDFEGPLLINKEPTD